MRFVLFTVAHLIAKTRQTIDGTLDEKLIVDAVAGDVFRTAGARHKQERAANSKEDNRSSSIALKMSV